MPSRKKIASAALKFAIPAVILGFLISRIDWGKLADQQKNYPLLVAAILIAFVGVNLSFVRWCLLARCQGIALSLVEALRLGSIGFLLSFVSAGSVGGDLFKAVFLVKQSPGKGVEAVASVMVDRGVGLFGLLLLVSCGFLVIDPPNASAGDTAKFQQIKWATFGLVIAGMVVLMILVFGGKGIDRFVQHASRYRFIGKVVAKIGPPLRMFHHHPIAFLVSIVMSVFVHTMIVLSMYLIAKSLYMDHPTLKEHFVIVPIGMLAAALPIAPAGLGVYEAAIEWLYKVVPKQPTEASGTVVALVFEIVKMTLALFGTIFYWTSGSKPIEDEIR